MWFRCVAVLKCVRWVYASRATHFIQLTQDWNVLALDGSNWQTMDLFDFQTAIEVCCNEFTAMLHWLLFIWAQNMSRIC